MLTSAGLGHGTILGGQSQRWLLMGLGPLAALAMQMACGPQPLVVAQQEAVEVAVVAPFTGSEAMADAARVWSLVEDTVNAAGGLHGHPLVVRAYDTPLTSADDLSPVLEGFEYAARQGHKFVVSLIAGDVVDPIMQAAAAEGIVAMSLIAEREDSNRAEFNGMLLRAVPSTEALVRLQAKQLAARGERSMVVIGPTDGAGRLDLRHGAMLDQYEQCATCEVASVDYPAAEDPYYYDWASLGDRVMAHQPDAVFLSATNYQALDDTIYVLSTRGFEGNFYFAYGGLVPALVTAFRPSTASRFRAFELSVPSSDVLLDFRAEYVARYGAELTREPRLLAAADFLGLFALAWMHTDDPRPENVARVMKQLPNAGGESLGPLDFGQVAGSLSAGRSLRYQGLSGSLGFNETGEVAEAQLVEYGVSGEGEFEPRL